MSWQSQGDVIDRTLKLLTWCAEDGLLVCCNIDVRKLWYAGLVEWCSLTEVRLTSVGLAVLYRAEENGTLG